MTLSTSTPFAVIFPGQGSQKKGMLSQLANTYPEILHTFDEASQTLHYNVWELVQNDDARLNETQYTQPAILTASIAIWRLLKSLTSFTPSYVMGHSLGEYSALVAAESLTFSEALRLVSLRGQAMQEAVPVGTGSMAAVLGLPDEKVEQLCQKASELTGLSIEPANLNAPGQIVVSGYKQTGDVLAQLVKAEGGKTIALPVSVPSHCQLMQPAAKKLAELLNQTLLKPAQTSVIPNVSAQPTQDEHLLKQGLINQLTHPVRWVESEQFLVNAGIHQLIECGPGNILTGLTKKMPPLTSMTTAQPEQLSSTLSFLLSSSSN